MVGAAAEGFSMKWVAVVCAAALVSCRPAAAPLTVLSTVPEFTLTAQSGQPFAGSSLRGQVWVADFIFTNCMGPCPRMTAQMRQIQTALGPSSGVKLVSFTVDPERDTPPVLTDYARRMRADTASWTFLTGPMEALDKVRREGFLLGAGNSSLDHTTRFVLVDRAMRIRGYYDTSEPECIPRLVADIRRLLTEPA